MKKELILMAFIFFLFFNPHSYPQYKKNSLTLEVLGKSLIFCDISYSRYLSEKFQIGAGLGLQSIGKLSSIDGTSTNVDYSIPVYGAYAFGTKKHHVVSELGITLTGYTNFKKRSGLYGAGPFVSVGYELKGENYVFRVPLYLFYIGDNDFFPPVIPWFGLGLGRLF